MRLRCVLLLLLGVISGCKTIPPDDAVALPVAERQARLLQLTNWQANGSIALNSPDNALSATLDWQQQQQDYAVTLTAAFGQGLRVTQRGDKATLTTRGKPAASGPSAEALILQELRVRVPLNALSYWIRGLPGEGTIPGYDRYGRLLKLQYLDADGLTWKARFKRYEQIDALDLPALIEVVGGPYKIRLAINQWDPSTTSVTPAPAVPGKRLTIPGVTG